MVEAKKGDRVIGVGTEEGAKELMEEGYTFFDEDTGEAVSDPVAEVKKYSGTFSTAPLGFSMDDFIKACKENGIFITMKE